MTGRLELNSIVLFLKLPAVNLSDINTKLSVTIVYGPYFSSRNFRLI